jgi:hypothetical protein
LLDAWGASRQKLAGYHAIIPPAPADPTAKADAPPPASPAFSKPAKPPPSGSRCRYIKWAEHRALPAPAKPVVPAQGPLVGAGTALPPPGDSPGSDAPARPLHRHLTAPQTPVAAGRSPTCPCQGQVRLTRNSPPNPPCRTSPAPSRRSTTAVDPARKAAIHARRDGSKQLRARDTVEFDPTSHARLISPAWGGQT